MKNKRLIRGVVTNCIWTNVYRTSDATELGLLTMISALTEVRVDMNSSTSDFYKIRTTDGVEGFCKRKHIALSQGG